MKINTIILSIVFACFIFSCSSDRSINTDSKDALIENLIQHPDVQSTISNGKIILVQNSFCQEFKCKAYFQSYKGNIQMYTREDIFMRGLKNYAWIEEINEREGFIKLVKRTPDGEQTIEVKI